MTLPGRHIYLQYAEPIGSGLRIFAIAAACLFIPYVIFLYRRYGRVDPRRLWVSATFLLFIICAWALVLMPFPDLNSSICQQRHVDAQLVPFQWVSETIQIAERQGSGLSGLWRNPAFVVRVFNVLLLFPLGVYLRRWWGRGLASTTAIAFGLSMAFEVTQWTGVFGLYRCAYRTFDVDDLIANTAGAMLGWALASLFVFIPHKRDVSEEETAPDSVTVPRRLLAALIDYLLASTVAGVAVVGTALLTDSPVPSAAASRVSIILGLTLVTVVVPSIRGRTPGQALLGMDLVVKGDASGQAGRRILRAVIVWCPVMTFLSLGDATAQTTPSHTSMVMTSLAFVWVCFLTIATVVGRGVGPADRWSGTSLRARNTRTKEFTPA